MKQQTYCITEQHLGTPLWIAGFQLETPDLYMAGIIEAFLSVTY